MFIYITGMARRKTISDRALLDRLLAEIGRVGPQNLPFARAAAAAGLAPATLVQRFASREAMVEAILVHAWDRLDLQTAEADADAPEDACGAVELLMRLTPEDEIAFAVENGLLLLREDMRNPALRARGAAWGARLSEALGRRLSQDPEEASVLGWQMANVWQGALVWWGFRRHAAPGEAVRAALQAWCCTALPP